MQKRSQQLECLYLYEGKMGGEEKGRTWLRCSSSSRVRKSWHRFQILVVSRNEQHEERLCASCTVSSSSNTSFRFPCYGRETLIGSGCESELTVASLMMCIYWYECTTDVSPKFRIFVLARFLELSSLDEINWTLSVRQVSQVSGNYIFSRFIKRHKYRYVQ